MKLKIVSRKAAAAAAAAAVGGGRVAAHDYKQNQPELTVSTLPVTPYTTP